MEKLIILVEKLIAKDVFSRKNRKDPQTQKIDG